MLHSLRRWRRSDFKSQKSSQGSNKTILMLIKVVSRMFFSSWYLYFVLLRIQKAILMTRQKQTNWAVWDLLFAKPEVILLELWRVDSSWPCPHKHKCGFMIIYSLDLWNEIFDRSIMNIFRLIMDLYVNSSFEFDL